MPRVKRGVAHAKKRKSLLEKTKGYRWNRKNTVRAAKTAVNKALVHAYTDRKKKKRVNRALWQIKINAAAREQGLSYSKLMALLKKESITVDRKVLSQLAQKQPKVFVALVAKLQK